MLSRFDYEEIRNEQMQRKYRICRKCGSLASLGSIKSRCCGYKMEVTNEERQEVDFESEGFFVTEEA